MTIIIAKICDQFKVNSFFFFFVITIQQTIESIILNNSFPLR
jgi:hypothetical protein